MKRSILTTLAILPLSLTALPTMAKSLNNHQDRLGYTLGVQTGKVFKARKMRINPQAFAMGLKDAMGNRSYKMSEKEMAATMTAFRKQTLARLQGEMKQASQKNAQAGATFMAKNQHKSGIKTTASGLQYRIIKAGNGRSPAMADTVTVNYKGSLINGKVFDSSYQRGKPVTFPVKGVIKGWQEALTMMKPGSVWMLYIPSKLAYGQRGAPGAIGPNETLVFKVNLISVKRS